MTSMSKIVIKALKEIFTEENTAMFLIGSVAVEEYHEKISDIDLMYVIERPDTKENYIKSFKELRNQLKIFRDKVTSMGINTHNVWRRDCEIIFREDMEKYLTIFPVRVWEPIVCKRWKQITGKSIPILGALPKALVMNDFYVSYNYFVDYFIRDNIRPYWRTKFFLRALTKAIWIKTGRKPRRQEALILASKYFKCEAFDYLKTYTEKGQESSFHEQQIILSEENEKKYIVEGLRYLSAIKKDVFSKNEFLSDKIICWLILLQKIYSQIRSMRMFYVSENFENEENISTIYYNWRIIDMKLIMDVSEYKKENILDRTDNTYLQGKLELNFDSIIYERDKLLNVLLEAVYNINQFENNIPTITGGEL